MAKQIDQNQVIFNEVSPGPAKTNFGATIPWIIRTIFVVLLASKARTVKEASKTYFHAFAVAGEETHGSYLSDNEIAP